jgi:hypothetical protein
MVISATDTESSRFPPRSRPRPRVVPGHHVDALPHEFGHQEPGAQPLQQCVHAAGDIRRNQQIVRAPGVSRGLHPELARRVAGQDVAGEHAVDDELAVAGRNSLIIEWRAAHRLGNMRPFGDGEPGGEHLLTH